MMVCKGEVGGYSESFLLDFLEWLAHTFHYSPSKEESESINVPFEKYFPNFRNPNFLVKMIEEEEPLALLNRKSSFLDLGGMEILMLVILKYTDKVYRWL